MPALSRASADDAQVEGRPVSEPVAASTALWPEPQFGLRTGLWPEAGKAAVARATEAVFGYFRGGSFYRLTLRGPMPDRISFQPHDPRPRRLDDAEGFFHNRFRFAGHVVDVKDGSIFDCETPSEAFARALHGFEWLRHLEAAGGDEARRLALELAGEWLARNAHYTEPAWQPEVIATRFINLFAHGRFFLINSDLLWRSRFFVSLRNQARVLGRTASKAPDGLPRLQGAAALVLAGICLADGRSASVGLAKLKHEIERQILPDGGYASRSPEALIEAFLVLSMTQQALDAANRETQTALRSALDRMAPMLRFFRLGDGGLGVFNGGRESAPELVTALLARDEAQGKPFGHAPHCAFQRMTAGRVVVLMDVGGPPQGAFSDQAHAGCLALEMSAGTHRIIVNCGAALGPGEHWGPALRATAAHSTMTLADTSSATILPPGWLATLLGPRLLANPSHLETRRSETEQGLLVEASHEFYLPRFGVVHRRRLVLAPRGALLTGVDRLIPTKKLPRHGAGIPFAVRFHIHPDIRLSLAQDGGSVILKLPNGEGWRFRCGGGALTIEESVYLGGGSLRRTEQLVISGYVKDADLECAWLFERMGAV